MEKRQKEEQKKKSFTVTVPMEVYQAAKIAAVKANVTLRRLVQSAIEAKLS